ncbi:CopG family transcriptional regulator [Halogeometricum borinquense]|uniref:CopG family transcriptional regulator n=1 Tax=Halogeometricum borinquense TaxID=60847 RepID=A0A6C0UI82_9EURY|nr:CopG family transcriptional regulator [Halogeometricum borinquense]QIB75135.1 CopG family transcriptional regulator [Halogeometricum borinquense]QIQ75884.1 CopG family transcriptional regulator [Halogeometricum borinquense]
MGGDRVETLSDELERWVEKKSSESGIDRSELVKRALTAYRLVDEGDLSADGELGGRTDDLEERVTDLEADLDEKVTDLRERVIQVKRESDRKAPEDHGHPELAADTESALNAVADVRETVSELERRMDAGFENYEDVLEYLTDTADETEAKLDTVANAIVDLRKRTAEAERTAAKRAAATELKREANRKGISTANCQSCEHTVDISLLDVPYCPHCRETFDGVREKQGFFGSASLTTGRRPALEPPDETDAAPEPVFDDGDAESERDNREREETDSEEVTEE